MGLILLTGAGFSRNWGGWLASEAFEYLVGCDGLHPRVRTMLWNHKDKGGFEAVYQSLKDGATNPTDRDVFQGFHVMVTGMFHSMGYGFQHALVGTNILNFLATFDAIFTLNQDTLLELKYPGDEEIRERSGIAPCSVELYEAVVAVNDVKRPSQFGQERDCWSPFRSERPARPAGQEVACRL